MTNKLFVIGNLDRLPRRPRDAIESRRTDDPEEAQAAVAIAPEDGEWNPLWDQLRHSFQDRGMAVHGVWIDENGWSRRPHKPWPGSMWTDPKTVHNLVWYRLCRDPKGYDPGDCKILLPGSKHFNRTLREVPFSYIDWCLGQDWIDPSSFFGRMLKLYAGRLARSHFIRLEEEMFDTSGFSPLDAQPGTTMLTVMLEEDDPGNPHWRMPPEWCKATVLRIRKPGNWSQSRPRVQIEAEDEAINQVWWSRGGQRLLWAEGLKLEPMPILHGRKARNRVSWAVVEGNPVVKGGDEDGLRVVSWDRTLEAIDRVSSAPDLDDLDRLYHRAVLLVDSLAMSEGLNPDSNPIKDELDESYLRRKDQLERREESLTDFKAASITDDEEQTTSKGRPRNLGGKVIQKLAGDMQAARVHEVIRRFRGCRTLDDLADVALWIRNNRDLFEDDSLTKLRSWYAHFKTEIVKEQLEELQRKYGSGEVVVTTMAE
jgi:hypothetical protein